MLLGAAELYIGNIDAVESSNQRQFAAAAPTNWNRDRHGKVLVKPALSVGALNSTTTKLPSLPKRALRSTGAGGARLGAAVGCVDGWIDGCVDGCALGREVGCAEGSALGWLVGSPLG
jgi:hypothetical protein